MSESFGARLRRERERRHITLTQIAASTKINASLFEALERDDVSRWPNGIFVVPSSERTLTRSVSTPMRPAISS